MAKNKELPPIRLFVLGDKEEKTEAEIIEHTRKLMAKRKAAATATLKKIS